MNIDKIDRIMLSIEDVDKINKWHEYHFDEIKGSDLPLEECLLVIKGFYDPYQNRHDMEIGVHFKLERSKFNLSFKIYDLSDNTMVLSYSLDDDWIESQRFNWTTSLENVKIPEKVAQEQARFFTKVSLETFHYMVHVSENVIEIKEQKTIQKKAKKKSSKTGLRYVKINVNKYVIDFKGGEPNRKNERHVLAWNVRGHWRHYKSGKKVWIKPYPKGNKEDIESKIYKL